jgi:hypothetical protein
MDSLNEGYKSRSFRAKSDEAAMIFFRRRAIPLFEGESDLFTFVWMAQCLLFRRTSKLKDEPFCLASTLGLDTYRILRCATLEERMREFFAMLSVIPSTVFFLHGPKLQFPGYRWAPTTFLETGSNPVVRWRGEEVTRIAQRDERNCGLRVSLPGCLISFTKTMDPEAKASAIWIRKATLADSFLVEIENRDDWRRMCHFEKVVLVTENDMNLPLGFLASIRKEDGGVIFLDYLCAVNVTPVKEMINWESVDHHSEERGQGDCTREFADQMWCVG